VTQRLSDSVSDLHKALFAIQLLCLDNQSDRGMSIITLVLVVFLSSRYKKRYTMIQLRRARLKLTRKTMMLIMIVFCSGSTTIRKTTMPKCERLVHFLRAHFSLVR
jgi:hypothetical protein